MIARRHFHLSLPENLEARQPQMTANNLPCMSTRWNRARELHLRLSRWWVCMAHKYTHIHNCHSDFDIWPHRIDCWANARAGCRWRRVKCIENYKLRCFYDSRKLLYKCNIKGLSVHRRAAAICKHNNFHIAHVQILLRDICCKFFPNVQLSGCGIFFNSNFWCQQFFLICI